MSTNILYIAAALAAFAALVLLFIKRRAKEPAHESTMETWIPREGKSKKKAEPQGDPALYELGMSHVSDKPIMYALTTCQHCSNTRKFLDERNAEYTCIYLDTFGHAQRSELMEVVRTYNPRGTFPTILLPSGKVIVGYRRHLLEEAFHDAGKTA